jgi:hypothetical protein
VGDEALQALFLTKLIKEFASTSGEEDDDTYEHVGTILVNVSRVKEGREILLDPSRALLKHVLPQMQSKSVRRRQGVRKFPLSPFSEFHWDSQVVNC